MKKPSQTTIYFPKPGKANTRATLDAALDHAERLGIKHIVVASTSGATALRLVKLAWTTLVQGSRVRGFQESRIRLSDLALLAALAVHPILI